MQRRCALARIGLIALCWWLAAVPGSAKPRPNFVIMLADDLGYGDLACYGNRDIRSPELTALAQEGLRLTSFYSASPVCSPSRAALLTGRVPQREGFADWLPNDAPHYLRRDAVTLAGLLKQGGYATALFGKWHLNGKWDGSQPLPNDHGFADWLATGGYPMPSQRDPENFYRNGQAVGKITGYSSTIIADEAIGWLKRREAAKPFFLFVSFHAPHEEVASAAQYVNLYAAGNEASRALYYANVTELSYETGRVLRALAAAGVRDNTLVLFTSDNGPEVLNRERAPWTARSHGSAGQVRGMKLRGMKLDLYEGGIRVPALLRWPGVIQAGQVSDAVVSMLDVLPTFCELAGVAPPAGHVLDGVSVNRLLRGQPWHRVAPLYWQYDNAHTAEPNDLPVPKLAWRDGVWKLLTRRDFTAAELYDLRADPGEHHNLARQQPARVATLLRALRRRHAEINRVEK